MKNRSQITFKIHRKKRFPQNNIQIRKQSLSTKQYVFEVKDDRTKKSNNGMPKRIFKSPKQSLSIASRNQFSSFMENPNFEI